MIFDLTKRKSGGGVTITSYTAASAMTINNAVNAANIPIIAQDEILIWNIKGGNRQGAGSAAVKFGMVVVQNGEVVNNSNTNRRASSVDAPDNMIPSSTPTNDTMWSIVDGHYKAASSTAYYIGANTIDFVQIPYDIGWAVSQ